MNIHLPPFTMTHSHMLAKILCETNRRGAVISIDATEHSIRHPPWGQDDEKLLKEAKFLWFG